MTAMPNLVPPMPNRAPQIPPHIFLQRKKVKNRPDELLERVVESHSQHIPYFDYKRAVHLVKSAFESANQGRLRELESELQNRIIRYLSHQPSQLQTVVQKIFSNAQTVIKDPRFRAGVSQEISHLQSGIISVIAVLQNIENNFRRRQRLGMLPAERELYLGTNDYLDAARCIDLIGIEYDSEGPQAIDLYQVKSPKITLTRKEIQDIQDNHQLFVDELASGEYAFRSKLTTRNLSLAEKELKEFLATAAENKEHENVAEFLKRHSDLLLALLTEPPASFEDEAIEEYLTTNGMDNQSLIDLHLLFQPKKFHVACQLLSELGLGTPNLDETQIRTMEQFHLWALQYLPPAEKLKAIYTDFEVEPQYITQDTQYRSIIDHGGPQIIMPIRPGR
ncbi:MAG: hypothetical protein ACOYUZ_03735 [Patescibacteria group bacterium]